MDTPSLISDVDNTIRYWRNTGVVAREVRAALGLPARNADAGWADVSRAMIRIALYDEYIPRNPQVGDTFVEDIAA